MSLRTLATIAAALALCTLVAFPASAQKRGNYYARCPLTNVTAEIVDPLPAPWSQLPQRGSFLSASIRVINGEKLLSCNYLVSAISPSTDVATKYILRKFPRGSTSCTPYRRGFNCI